MPKIRADGGKDGEGAERRVFEWSKEDQGDDWSLYDERVGKHVPAVRSIRYRGRDMRARR